MGVNSNNTNTNPMRLSFKDVCCTSICCKRLHRLSNEPSLWSSLLSSDFPLRPTTSNPSKALYQSWYEKDKAKRSAAHTRAVLRIESRVAEHSRRLEELRMLRGEETTKFNGAAAELSNLHKVRQASVALNVWQPEVIRGRQKQIVEQCSVPVDSRINALEMELKLCKQHLIVFEKNYVSVVSISASTAWFFSIGEKPLDSPHELCVLPQRDERRRLEQAKEQLLSMKYHPLQDFPVVERTVDDSTIKRKRLKLHLTV